MTIVTKPITEKKVNILEQPLVDNEINGALPAKGDLESNDTSLLTPPPQYVVRARRVTTATTLCLLLTALLVMSIGIIGGVILYRQFARSQMQRFRGWCSIPYENFHIDDPSYLKGHRDNMLSDSRLFKSLKQDQGRHAVVLKEEFEIDLESENYETITVPDFIAGRMGRFIHDFNANKTGIVDIQGKRCFVMPMNRNVVIPPRSMFDLINKILNGYYEVNTETVRESMRVVPPPIKDYHSVGYFIAKECRMLPTYLLEKVNSPVYKRSTISHEKETTFTEFAGHHIQEINIVNLVELDEYEAAHPHSVALVVEADGPSKH